MKGCFTLVSPTKIKRHDYILQEDLIKRTKIYLVNRLSILKFVKLKYKLHLLG